jgi:hypothetical protein
MLERLHGFKNYPVTKEMLAWNILPYSRTMWMFAAHRRMIEKLSKMSGLSWKYRGMFNPSIIHWMLQIPFILQKQYPGRKQVKIYQRNIKLETF